MRTWCGKRAEGSATPSKGHLPPWTPFLVGGGGNLQIHLDKDVECRSPNCLVRQTQCRDCCTMCHPAFQLGTSLEQAPGSVDPSQAFQVPLVMAHHPQPLAEKPAGKLRLLLECCALSCRESDRAMNRTPAMMVCGRLAI